MTQFRISGVWKDSNNVITHYAFHEVTNDNKTNRAKKITKVKAVELLETKENEAYTWLWNYSSASWVIGEKVQVINSVSGKYLRTDPDKKITDNLSHLIDYDWLS